MLNLSTASADSLNIVGVYNLSFSMKGKTIQNPVYVCSNLNQKAIIGMDVIKKFGLVYSPLKDTFHFEDTPINSNYFFQPKMTSNRSAAASLTAMDDIDDALTEISTARASFGATQNRFEAVISNLQVNAENQAASRGRIVDADFAAETAKLTKGQIMQQAATAMLAQANQMPNVILSLLK
jgi:flagellin-like hook-associated protein FlgL